MTETYQQQKQQVLSLFPPAIGWAEVQQNRELEGDLREAARRLAEEKLFVVVAGEFKQGKSSLINALLDEPGLCPVDVDITTNLISTISYGDEEKITVLTGPPGQEQATQIGRQEIADYVTEQRNRDNVRQARLLVVEMPNEKLKEGLILVDTPGVGGLNKGHTDIAYAFIPNADAVLFVSDALAPLTTAELDFVRLVARHCQNIIFVVTKTDAVGDYQAVVDNSRQKLVQILDRPSDGLSIIPVSSLAKLDYLESQDAEDLADSNFATLERELWQLISQHRGDMLLLRALGELGRVVALIKEPLQAEWIVYQEHTQAELDQFEGQCAEAQAQLEHLLGQSAAWRTQLTDGVQRIRTTLLGQLEQGFDRVHQQMKNYLLDNRLLQSPDQIVRLLEVDMDGLISDLGSELSRQAAQLHTELEASTGLDLNPFQVGPQAWEKSELLAGEIDVQKTSRWRGILAAARRSSLYSTDAGPIGGAVGRAAGFVVGLALESPDAGAEVGERIGRLFAQIAAISMAIRRTLSDIREEDRHQVFGVIEPWVDDSNQHCTGSLNDMVSDFERAMLDEFLQRLGREEESCKRTLKSAQQARERSQEEAARRVAELKEPLQQLGELQSQVVEMAEAVLEQREAATLGQDPERVTAA
jgi:predicted GTPase